MITINNGTNSRLVPLVKWLVSNRVITLRGGAELIEEVRAGGSFAIEVSSDLVSEALDELKSLDCEFEMS